MKTLLPTLLAASALAFSSQALAGVLADHPGKWLGAMSLPGGQTMQIGADFFTRADGKPWASAAIPTNGVVNIPVSTAVESGDSVELDLSAAKLKLTWAGDHFDGVFTQGKTALPLTLTRVESFPAKARPQTPSGPVPYSREAVALRGAGDVMLGAELTLPKGVRRPPLVILVHGSGPNNRDQEAMGHKSFAVWADYLTRRGVAVLRYDKRGVGASTGDYNAHTQADLVADLAAVTAQMRSRRQFGKIGIIGHSEGPHLAAEVLASDPKAADFLVSLAGVGLNGLELMLLQDRLDAIDNGATPQELERLTAYFKSWYGIVLAEPDGAARGAKLRAMQATLSKEDRDLIALRKMNQGTLSLSSAQKPALPALLSKDPTPHWRRVKTPVLAINGELDHQVPPESLTAITAALKAGGNRKVETVLMPRLNHLLQTATTGSTDEYDRIDETVAPAALERVAAFVLKQR